MGSQSPQVLTAIDIGSNSFHMVIAKIDQGELRIIEQLGEKVQLARGMVDSRLAPEAVERGMACLQRFKQRIDTIPEGGVIRVVGTNALRAAKNRADFIEPAEALLGCQVEVIAGREEARLVYLGVAHTQADDESSRLVIDIGGGSTELIVGQRFESRITESLHMGCVSYMRFFPDGEINALNFRRAYHAAYRELLNILDDYEGQWANCVGSSGTLLAVEQVLIQSGLSEGGIHRQGLVELEQRLLSFETIEEVSFQGLKENRRPVFASGIAITKALFDALNIESMHLSDGALREGVLYDLLGRLSHEDVRERTVQALEQRYDVNIEHGRVVADRARALLEQVAGSGGLGGEVDGQLLVWAARLHEVGLAVSHSQYHKHGEYLLYHADLAGFSRSEQEALSLLVRSHRRKLSRSQFELPSLSASQCRRLQGLALLLRLAVLFKHASPGREHLPFQLSLSDQQCMTLTFEAGWLAEHPLTAADLEQEQAYLKDVDLELCIVGAD